MANQIINFYPQNKENEGKRNFWNYIYFDGILQTYASEAGAKIADMVESDSKLEAIPDGIHAGVFHMSNDRIEKCLAFIYSIYSNGGSHRERKGLIVHIADLRSVEHAYNCYIEERLLI